MTEHTTSPGIPGTPTITTGTPGAASRSGGGGPGLFARCVAEAAGSFLVIVVGIGATMLATEAALQPGLVLGFAVVAAMIAFGHVSGGHFNPAVTLGSAVAGRTEWKAVLPYVVAQVLGAAAAAGLLWLVLSSNAQLTGIDAFFGSASNGFDEHSPAGFPLTSAFLIEVVAAALLVAVFLGPGARGAVRGLAPFAVGLPTPVSSPSCSPSPTAGTTRSARPPRPPSPRAGRWSSCGSSGRRRSPAACSRVWCTGASTGLRTPGPMGPEPPTPQQTGPGRTGPEPWGRTAR
ncbi:aquaporin [Arthrobacter sp. RIT-PI-e]|uniref:aquaporin n=1 Tax=Arthrobacter sp. RIT-PI-e TaxID=1681197 RepID=UPI000675D5CA|nr:aquaporin [Arthrobacter sp. RIT-PI-e]